MTQRNLRSAFVGIALLLATTCGGGGGGSPTAPSPIAAAVNATRIIILSGNLGFGSIALGSTATSTLTINNSGNAPLAWTGLGTGSAAVTASTYSGTVPAGGSSTVALTFSPTVASSYSGTITVTANQTSGTNTIAYWGTGTSPGSSVQQHDASLYLSGNSGITLAFGSVVVGTSGTYPGSLGITNNGTTPLVWTGIDTGSSTVTASPTNGTANPGEYVPITLTFAPTTVAAVSGTLTIFGNQTSGSNTISWFGSSVAPPATTGGSNDTRLLYLSGNSIPGQIAFGDVVVGTSDTQYHMGMANNGNSLFTWTAIDTGSPTFTISPTSGTLAAGGYIELPMTFTPTGTSSYSGTLTVYGNQTGYSSGDNTMTWTGNGISYTPPASEPDGPILYLSGNSIPGQIAFGDVVVGTSDTQYHMGMANNGNSLFTWTAIDTGSPTFTISPTSGTLTGDSGSGGGYTELPMTFTPPAVGSYSGTLTVHGNHISGSNTMSWTGNGITAPPPAGSEEETVILTLSGNLDFGEVAIGSSATASLNMANSGNSHYYYTGVATGNSAVTSSHSSGTLRATNTETITLTFTPTEATTYSGTVTLTGNHTGGNNTIAWTASTGTSTGAVISLSGDHTFETVAVGFQAIIDNFTISNTGDIPLIWTGLTATHPQVTIHNTSPTSGTIAAGASMQVKLWFQPTAVTTYSGTVTVIGNQTSGTNTHTYTGTGTGLAVSASPSALNFGDLPFYEDLNPSSTKTLAVTITASSAISCNQPYILSPQNPQADATGFYVFTAQAFSLSAGETEQIDVTWRPVNPAFFPQSFAGTHTATLRIDCQNGAQPLNVPLTGTASEGTRIIQLSTSAFDWGERSIHQVPPFMHKLDLTITNSGTAILNWGNPDLHGTNPKALTKVLEAIPDTSNPTGGYAFVPSAYHGSLIPGASQTITIAFDPGEEKTYSGTITFPSDATNQHPTLSLTGTGYGPP
jgi:hypothetical protein